MCRTGPYGKNHVVRVQTEATLTYGGPYGSNFVVCVRTKVTLPVLLLSSFSERISSQGKEFAALKESYFL